MAAAPLKDIIAAEAAGALVAGAALLIWTGDVAARLGLPAAPPSWATVRLVAVLLIGFGALLWATRNRVAGDPTAVRALAIGHVVAAAVLAFQHIAIWNTSIGLALAFLPLGLAVRYTQYALRGAPEAPSAAPSA